jgi:predicted ATP-grasp superfamily ATP-dependent carboligase/protein-tyrosine-phosphatase
MSRQQTVLILGPIGRVGVNIARSLQKLGVPSLIGLIGDREYALRSRAIGGFVMLPADTSSPAFAAALGELRGQNVDMIMPCSDRALRAIVSHEEELRAKFIITSPPAAVLRQVLDKTATLEIAERCGISVPKPHAIETIEQLDGHRAATRFPIIAKPATPEGRRDFAVRYFDSFEELRATFQADPGFGARNVIQEYAPGRGVGVAVLMHDGKPIAEFQHGRLKELPASGGASVLAESEPLDPQLEQASLTLLRALGWTGVAMVEFRRNDADGSWVLMEVNGRYWGSLAAALLAGVDFPRYDWQLAHGLSADVPSSYRSGVRMRWTAGDVERLVGVIRRVPKDSPTHPSRLREFVRFFGDFNPSTKSALWSLSDPGPAVADVARYINLSFKKAARAAATRLVGADVLERWHQVRMLSPSARRQYRRLLMQRAVGVGPRFDPSAGTPIRSLLFVCKGNVFRSAFAAAFARDALRAQASEVHIDSAGMHALAGRAAEPLAQEAAAEAGLSLGDHVAQPISEELIERADIVFVMDYLNAAEFYAAFGSHAKKMRLLGSRDDALCEIADPEGKDSDAVRACFAQISSRLTDVFSSTRFDRPKDVHHS